MLEDVQQNLLYNTLVLILASSLEYPERIRVVSVFEPLVCLIVLCVCVSKFTNFFLFHPPLFIQYSTEECSTVQLLARSPEYPQVQRIRVASVVEFCVCLLVPCVSAKGHLPNAILGQRGRLLLTSSFTDSCAIIGKGLRVIIEE